MKMAAILIVCVFIQSVGVFAYPDTLQLVNMIYRHGDRTPGATFPTNPVPVSVWPGGFSALTVLGMSQQYKLGQYMRRRYDGFINDSYLHEEIYVRSTDTDRTLMSAEAHLAGLYPPTPAQTWNDSLPWQPIPVHTAPALDDYLSLKATCPRLGVISAEQYKTKRVQDHIKENQPFFDYLSLHAGMEVNIRDNPLYDILKIQTLYGYESPSWYNDTVRLRLSHLMLFGLNYLTTDESIRLKVGPFLETVLKNMQNKVEGNDSAKASKIYMYSGHDTNILYALRAMGIPSSSIPPYAATVLIELHKTVRGDHFVRLLYKDSPSEPRRLQVLGCAVDCPFDEFTSLTRRYVPDDWEAECGLKQSSGLDKSSLAIISAVCGAAFAAVIFFLTRYTIIMINNRKQYIRYSKLDCDSVQLEHTCE